jgi:hypothetical protein
MAKSRREGRTRHVAHKGTLEIREKFVFRSLKETGHSKDRGIDGNVNLKLILGKWVRRVRVGLV